VIVLTCVAYDSTGESQGVSKVEQTIKERSCEKRIDFVLKHKQLIAMNMRSMFQRCRSSKAEKISSRLRLLHER
jgi:hypothetical protein